MTTQYLLSAFLRCVSRHFSDVSCLNLGSRLNSSFNAAGLGEGYAEETCLRISSSLYSGQNYRASTHDIQQANDSCQSHYLPICIAISLRAIRHIRLYILFPPNSIYCYSSDLQSPLTATHLRAFLPKSLSSRCFGSASSSEGLKPPYFCSFKSTTSFGFLQNRNRPTSRTIIIITDPITVRNKFFTRCQILRKE